MQSLLCLWGIVGCGTGESPAESGGPICSHLANLGEDVQVAVIGMATDYLWSVTGRKYGTCPTSVRPCETPCGAGGDWGWGGVSGGSWYPYGSSFLRPMIWGGEWINLVCGSCAGRCECGPGLSTLRLPGPVAEILEIRIDGAVLPEAAYRVDNVGIVRLDGESWPQGQKMSNDPLTDPDTFLVSYLRGRPAPPGGQIAAGALSCEIAKMLCGDKGCRLPKRVTSINREGVTIDMIDSFSQMWTKGSTGLTLVDMWIASERIGQRGSTVLASPDMRPYRNGPLV